jgi:PAS domain S-box-containing protein
METVSASPSNRPARILIIDDDPALLEALPDTVRMHLEGAAVETSGSAQTALELIASIDYEVIVTDIRMPQIDGLTLLAEIMKIRPDTPTLLITGHGEEAIAVQAVQRGAYAFLTKPMDRNYFVAWVRRALQTRELQRRLSAQQEALKLHAAALQAELIQRQRVEEALRESEMKFRSVVQSANDAIVLADSMGTVLLANLSAQLLFGYPEAEIVGKPLTLLMPPRYHALHARGLERMQAGGESTIIGRTLELHGVRKDGLEFPIELSLGSWRTAESILYCGIIRDITERKRAEKTRAQLAALMKASDEKGRS